MLRLRYQGLGGCFGAWGVVGGGGGVGGVGWGGGGGGCVFRELSFCGPCRPCLFYGILL